MERLDAIADPRHQSYVTYPSRVLWMSRILSAIFYISGMRKTSEEFNSAIAIENTRKAVFPLFFRSTKPYAN